MGLIPPSIPSPLQHPRGGFPFQCWGTRWTIRINRVRGSSHSRPKGDPEELISPLTLPHGHRSALNPSCARWVPKGHPRLRNQTPPRTRGKTGPGHPRRPNRHRPTGDRPKTQHQASKPAKGVVRKAEHDAATSPRPCRSSPPRRGNEELEIGLPVSVALSKNS